MLRSARVQKRAFAAQELPPTKHVPQKYTGISLENALKLREKHTNPALFLYYPEDPIMLVEGNMQYVWDSTGKRYLDFIAGIVTVSVGHSHPRIVEVAQRQHEKIQHTTNIYLNEHVGEFAQQLTSKLPEGLDCVYFTNSGSEANDLAMLMARSHTESFDMIALRNGYHGMSEGTRGITALNTWKSQVPAGFGFHHAICPNGYRGLYKYDDPNAGEKYANDVNDLMMHACTRNVAGFICETIQGVGGTIPVPDNYLKNVYKHVRAHGGLCIADEVQGGFGRLGTHYWSFETQGVVPDIVTMAKGIGNGAPLAAVVTTKEIAESIAPAKGLHFNTYGGNPVSSAIGKEVLSIIDDENLQERSGVLGARLLDGLNKLKDKYELIGDVRGKGLMVGVELVKDRDTLEPAPEETNQIFLRLKEMGVLIGKGGLYGNTFRLKPPMCISEQDVDFVVDCMDVAFGEL